MPITVPTSFLSFSSFFLSSPLTRSKLLAKANAQNVQIVLILKSSCNFFKKEPVTLSTWEKNFTKFMTTMSTSRLIFRSPPRVALADWPGCFPVAYSDWSTQQTFVILLGCIRMSCHRKNSPAFRNECHFRFLKARVQNETNVTYLMNDVGYFRYEQNQSN